MLERLKKERDEADKMMEAIGKEQEPPAPPAPNPDDSQKPPTAPPDEPPAPAAPPETPPSDNQEVERLQGEITRFQQEITRLRAQLDDENNQTYKSQALLFKSQRDAARDELRELKEQVKAQPPASPAPPTPPPLAEPDENDEDYKTLVEEYGAKAAKAIWRIGSKGKQVSPEDIAKVVEEKTKPMSEKLETVEQGTAEERFFNNLNSKVPDWKKMNGWEGLPQDPKFTAFLKETVPYQDYTFNDMLNHYYQQGDAAKVAQVFEAFKKTAPPAPEPPPPNPLEQHLEPTKTNRGTEIPTDKTKPTYTRAEIEEFDKKKRAGMLHGMTKEEIQAKSKLYQDAIFEGRVR